MKNADTQWRDAAGTLIDEEDRGLVYDLETLVSRRGILGVFGAVGAGGLLAACSATGAGSPTASPSSASSTPSSSPSASATATESATGEPLTEVESETGGPFPGDGSNGPNVLDDAGIVRSDITSSFGTSSTVAAGIPLTIALTVRDAATGDALPGKAVYLWHCDQEGRYSLYSNGVTEENYLRGVQETDAAGTVTYTSIFPACYDGRWPHIHFEVYESLANATSSGRIVKTSQIALPKEASDAVYATSGYESSVRNISRVSLSSDNVFGNDGGIHQIASTSGDVTSGYRAALTIGI